MVNKPSKHAETYMKESYIHNTMASVTNERRAKERQSTEANKSKMYT